MKMKKLLSTLLTLSLVVGLQAVTTAFAADAGKVIQLGAGEISGYDSTKGYDYIYMGSYNNSPVKWRVLDDQTNTGEAGFFLLSEDLLANDVYFKQDDSSNKWQGSDAQAWCTGFAKTTIEGGAFSSIELDAILETTKQEPSIMNWDPSPLSDEKAFFLSTAEVTNADYGFATATDETDSARIAKYDGGVNRWWLRSANDPFGPDIGVDVGIVTDSGSVIVGEESLSGVGARPAFNLNRTPVIFTSAATGGKKIGNLGTLSTPIDYTGNEWKLTLLDTSRSFAVTETTATAAQGETITFNYSGANTGANEYVSAMVVDSNGNVLYYGQIAKDSANGTASLTIPSELAVGSYTLKVFSEQLNGDKKTDYASVFVNISLSVHAHSYGNEETTEIPETGTDVPRTSDSSNMALWIGLMLASMLSFVVLQIVDKKRRSAK